MASGIVMCVDEAWGGGVTFVIQNPRTQGRYSRQDTWQINTDSVNISAKEPHPIWLPDFSLNHFFIGMLFTRMLSRAFALFARCVHFLIHFGFVLNTRYTFWSPLFTEIPTA